MAGFWCDNASGSTWGLLVRQHFSGSEVAPPRGLSVLLFSAAPHADRDTHLMLAATQKPEKQADNHGHMGSAGEFPLALLDLR